MLSVNSYGMTLEGGGNRRSVLPRGVHGAADPHFACAVRTFASMFPGRRYGGGALAVYLDGEPVVDVWTGWSDRRGRVPWTADTATMVFSATKGMASTVIHRLVDRGLIDYDEPVAEYWREFGANGKSNITVRQMMRHQAGLSALHGASKDDLLNHELMEERLAAARISESDIQRGGAQDCRAATVGRIRLNVFPWCESCCAGRYPVDGRGDPGG